MSKNSFIFCPVNLGRIWVSERPMLWTTMSSPKTMMKGKISYSTAEDTAGNRASSLTRPESMWVLVLLSKVSYKKTVQCFKAGPIPNLEGDMDGVELDLGLLHLDPHLGLEVGRCDRFQLAGSVCCESAPL